MADYSQDPPDPNYVREVVPLEDRKRAVRAGNTTPLDAGEQIEWALDYDSPDSYYRGEYHPLREVLMFRPGFSRARNIERIKEIAHLRGADRGPRGKKIMYRQVSYGPWIEVEEN